jgi:DNA-binding NtrC family response regulator
MTIKHPKILFADDDIELYKRCLGESLHTEFFWASTPQETLCIIKSEQIDAVILDIDFRDQLEGFDLIPQIKYYRPGCVIIMHSNNDSYQNHIRSHQAGCDEFASKSRSKPADAVHLARTLLARREENARLTLEARELIKNVGAVVESPLMFDVYKKAAICRSTASLNVLIQGPTGCGKELVAQAISRRIQAKPFIAMNCAAIPANLVEDQFFGHVRGAYTGSTADKAGVFEQADGGDVFLDEIAELSLSAQANLLRVLETKEITRIGSTRSKRCQFRVIAATHADLDERVRAGLFREDLLARLRGIVISIPGLHTRKEEIIPIARKVLESSPFKNVQMSKDFEFVLTRLPWPQNVRQLKQMILSTAAEVRSGVLTIGDLPEELFQSKDLNPIGKTNDGQEFVFRVDGNTSLEDAQQMLFQALLAFKRSQLGEKATQSSLAKSMNLTRSSFQRYLKKVGMSPV